jgi:hypothetical protein
MVGVLTSSPCTAELLGSWSAQFRLDHSLPCKCWEAPQQHAQVSACIINPVFSAQAGALLAGVLETATLCCCALRSAFPNTKAAAVSPLFGLGCLIKTSCQQMIVTEKGWSY